MTTRRKLLLAAPAAIVAPAAALAAARPSPLRAMYHEWQAAKNECNAECESMEANEANWTAAFERMTAIEYEAAAFVPQTMEDFAFKVIFADDDGDMSVNIQQPRLAQTAYEIAGIKPGPWHPGFGFMEEDAPSLAAETSEIMRLMRECIALRAYINGPDSPKDDGFANAAGRDLRALEKRLVGLPAKTVKEMAAKILVWTAYADPEEVCMAYDLDGPILAEIRQLTGFSDT